MEVVGVGGGGEIIHLSLHCHQQNDQSINILFYVCSHRGDIRQ